MKVNHSFENYLHEKHKYSRAILLLPVDEMKYSTYRKINSGAGEIDMSRG